MSIAALSSTQICRLDRRTLARLPPPHTDTPQPRAHPVLHHTSPSYTLPSAIANYRSRRPLGLHPFVVRQFPSPAATSLPPAPFFFPRSSVLLRHPYLPQLPAQPSPECLTTNRLHGRLGVANRLGNSSLHRRAPVRLVLSTNGLDQRLTEICKQVPAQQCRAMTRRHFWPKSKVRR